MLNADRVDCVEGEIRLNGTRRPSFTVNMDSIGSEGIVEMCMYGMWGSVCNPISFPGAWDVCERIGLDRDGTMYICTGVHVILFIYYWVTGGFPVTDDVSSYNIFGPPSLPIFGSVQNIQCNKFDECFQPFNSADDVNYCNNLQAGTAVLCSGI